MILDGKKKSQPLRTQPGSTGAYKHSPQMQAVIDRCRTPKQISPLKSRVPMNEEIARINTRMQEPGARGRR